MYNNINTVTENRQRYFAIILIIFLTSLVYLNSLDNSFHYDDFHSITENPHIRNINNIPKFFTHPEMFSGINAKMYRPLLLVTYAINYSIGGYEVFGYHVVNILLHTLNTVFVFLIASFIFNGSARFKVQGSRFKVHDLPAFTAALIFGVHTINTHPVNYISSRSVLLVSFFYLGAFYFYIRSGDSRQTQGEATQPSTVYTYYILAFIFYICALLSKEIAVTLPFVLLLYDYLFTVQGSRFKVHRFIRELPFWGINIIGYLMLRKVIMGRALIELSWRTLVEGAGDRRSIYINILTQIKVFVLYIKKLFLPTGLAVDHDIVAVSGIGEIGVLVSLAFILLILFFALYIRRRFGVISFGIFWFFIVLLPETILPLNLIVNEHRVYLSGVGFVFIAGFTFHRLMLRVNSTRLKTILAGLMLLFISLNAYGTVKRNEVWRNELTLWQDAVEKYPQHEGVHHSLGDAYKDQGLLDEALKEYLKAIELDPAYEAVHYNLGNLYTQLKRLDEAIDEYAIVLILDPTHSNAHNNLGLVLYRTGRYDEALSHYKRALEIKPDNPEVHYNLANTYRKKGLTDKAIYEYGEVLRLDDSHFGAYNNMGILYGMDGHYDEAAKNFERALEIAGDDKKVRYNLGFAYMKLGNCEAAKMEFKYLLNSDPDDMRIQRHLDKCEGLE